jgi:hypothetical protein
MKYLRRFDEKMEDTDLYDRISISKRDDLIKNKRTDFTKYEIKTIKDYAEKRGQKFVKYPLDLSDQISADISNQIGQRIDIIKNEGSAWQTVQQIYKIEDEWFIIINNLMTYPPSTKSYICDSIEGLIKCFEKERIVI